MLSKTPLCFVTTSVSLAKKKPKKTKKQEAKKKHKKRKTRETTLLGFKGLNASEGREGYHRLSVLVGISNNARPVRNRAFV